MKRWEILQGSALDLLQGLPPESVHCCVTSPPYWGLRDYGVAGQLGLEKTPQEYVAAMVAVFQEVRRVLRKDGTLWLNLGDSYAAGGMRNPSSKSTLGGGKDRGASSYSIVRAVPENLKPKDLVGIPWRVAFALQEAGWWLRQDIIWAKPNPMPESVRDRCTKAHEYIFLMSKVERYYYDAEAIAEPLAESSVERLTQPTLATQKGSDRVPGKTNGPIKAVGTPRNDGSRWNQNDGRGFFGGGTRNKRSVWEVTTQGFNESHFATFPTELVRPCILAGCPEGGTVLDPFSGSGTVGVVALRHGRQFLGLELNPEYVAMAKRRIEQDAPLFNRAPETSAEVTA